MSNIPTSLLTADSVLEDLLQLYEDLLSGLSEKLTAHLQKQL
jgi:hypothetical protein